MGQMNAPLFEIRPVDLQVEVNSYKPGNGLAWSQLFPLKFTPSFDLKGLEGNEGIPVSADRVAFNVKAPLKTRKTVGKWSGKLSKISIAREKGELEVNEYNDLKVISGVNPADKATAKYLVDLVYDDVKFVNDGIDYKVEIDALRIGSAGKQTFPANIEGDMATADEINFNIPTANFIGAVKIWSDVTADGLADIIKGQKAIATQGLKKPMFAFMEVSALEYLLAQTATQKRIASVIMNVAGLAATEVLSLDNINSYMVKHGYPRIIVLDSYATIEDKKGVQTTIKPWNEKAVVLSPEARLGYTYWKPVPNVPNVAAVQAQGAFAKTTVYSETNPMLEVTLAEAYVQPALSNRASLYFINALHAATWNAGA